MQPYEGDHCESATNESINSAREVVPFIMDLVKPSRTIDVGCGLGGWLSIFKECGVTEILGIDGDYVDTAKIKIPVGSFLARDLTKPLNVDSPADLVISLEVAEHLPPESAEIFIESLVKIAPVVLFSAAVPDQPGDFHDNCQWPEYWAKLFYQQDYVLFDCLRKKFWNNQNVSWWYSQNMLLFVRRSCLANYPQLHQFEPTTAAPMAIVHPKLYQLRQDMYRNLAASKTSSIRSLVTGKIKNIVKRSVT